LANLNLRDRDSILTKEGLLFRVFGYSHPPSKYICDAEYASADVFTSKDPRAPRTGYCQNFYKFYNAEGMKLVLKNYPQYTFFHEMLRQTVVGVNPDSAEVRKPKKRLSELMATAPKDTLVEATQRVLNTMLQLSNLSIEDFGVFGSMLHSFHNPAFSDIDLVVYGIKENAKMGQVLGELYMDGASGFKNEFSNPDVMQGKQWRYQNLTVKEFLWHQRRKQIYGLFNDVKSGRVTKAEFEPVKAWSEIISEYDPNVRIVQKGWVKLRARIVNDVDALFIPSIYTIKPIEVLSGPHEGVEAVRIFSYMEEFRLQAKNDEVVYVEGNLEEVASPNSGFHQITLTYCPRYYEQVLKVDRLNP
jgi:predicted nucleotidyltransferase